MTAKLAIHRDIPLVRVRPLVGIGGTIAVPTRNGLAVVEPRTDHRRRREALGISVVEEERRGDPASRRVERRLRREAVLRNAATPPWIERLGVEDAPPGADDGLFVHRVDAAEPRREAAVPIVLGVTCAEARRTIPVARKGEAARPATGVRVRTHRVEERKDVVLLRRRRVVVPTKAVVERQLVVDAPRIAGMEDPRVLPWIHRADVAEDRGRVVDRTEQEARNRAAGVATDEARGTAIEVERPGLVAVVVDVPHDLAPLHADLHGVRAASSR